jgi:hypothetical protein
LTGSPDGRLTAVNGEASTPCNRDSPRTEVRGITGSPDGRLTGTTACRLAGQPVSRSAGSPVPRDACTAAMTSRTSRAPSAAVFPLS